MYYLTIEDHFSSAHKLRGYKGKCENLHGHNWRVIAIVKGETLDKIGLLIDYHDLKKYLKEVLSELDHKNINEENEFFKTNNPSSENLAAYIFENLEIKLKTYDINPIKVESIQVYESEKNSCTFKK